ncbi:hypothetical protein QAD02_010401 [Eretmocerus hayati]|uniref:Uncharacterized protein n=1 Tax=Eretmocerus hayati TaxID=131215 RepID=A0ACC2NCB7_9HYME|nr:hypothetical protein QAD02_010401 [Eretmocerus hayati]
MVGTEVHLTRPNMMELNAPASHFSRILVHPVARSAAVAAGDDEVRLVDESQDELHDVEIYQAVLRSVSEWQERKQRRSNATSSSGSRRKREVSRVCYEDVGCFEDTGPFSYLEMLPSPPRDVGTRFYVYGSRRARAVPMELPAERIGELSSATSGSPTEPASSAIDPDLPTKVIVHGFGSSCDHVWVYEMRSALMAVIECNIVCVDWGPGSAVPNYVRAAANTRLVGRQLAKLVRSLGVPLDKLHLIGFSLGAHVAGFAGAELGNVSRITGLDPAGPLFESQDPRARLDATDAHFVDVIHSNGEQLILGGLGSWQPMGDVDFYPNGGRMQTGCSNLFLGAVSDIIWANPVEGRSLCNHRRAYKLFTDSISPRCRFPAFSCPGGFEGLLRGECFPCGSSCGDMGFYSDLSPARGQLYLLTREEEPFCAHQYQVKLHNSRHERPVKSYGKLQVTLVAEGAMNETFTMTRKDDEELLVGATLQKIVVPHPALASLDAVEMRYTAYSGWISSGLVSWAVDKLTVLDSYGAMYSTCRRGLSLESGRPIYLPLYRGDCSLPPELSNSSTPSQPTEALQDQSSAVPIPTAVIDVANSIQRHEQPSTDATRDKVQQALGIGPFTKEQNYNIATSGVSTGKNSLTNEVPQRSLGPFTREENIKIAKMQATRESADDDNDHRSSNSIAITYQVMKGPWAGLLDLASSAAGTGVELMDSAPNSSEGIRSSSNSVGRSFGASSASAVASLAPRLDRGNTGKNKESSARSLKLPVANPSVVNLDNETDRNGGSSSAPSMTVAESASTSASSHSRGQRRELQHTSRDRDSEHRKRRPTELMQEGQSSRIFTVQFLPERLAGILAQAERYARTTLLPLISQYTPSFIGGIGTAAGSTGEGFDSRPKYFPPLGQLFGGDINETDQSNGGAIIDGRTKYYYEFVEEVVSSTSPPSLSLSNNSKFEMSITRHEPDTVTDSSRTSHNGDWVPISVQVLHTQQHQMGPVKDGGNNNSFQSGQIIH